MKKFHIYNAGCVTTGIALKRAGSLLLENGWSEVKNASAADIILFNSCAFNKLQEDNSFREISRLQGLKKNGARFVLLGCLPKISEDPGLARFDGMVVDGDSVGAVAALLGPGSKIPSVKTGQWAVDELGREAFCVKVSSGCLSKCSYCAIRRAFPKLESVKKADIVKDFSFALKQGRRVFSLLSEDLGAYGKDIGTDMIALLEAIIGLKGGFKVALFRINPRWIKEFGPRLFKILDSGKIDYIALPVQSGSDRILRAMNRKYTAGEYRDFLLQIKTRYPAIGLRTDIMVGYPGETEEDFRKTLELILEIDYSDIKAYEFSPRINTPAWRLKDNVPKTEKAERLAQVFKLWKARGQMSLRRPPRGTRPCAEITGIK